METPPTLTGQIFVLVGGLMVIGGLWWTHPGLGVAALGFILVTGESALR